MLKMHSQWTKLGYHITWQAVIAQDKRSKPQKSPFLSTFTSMTSRDDVIMAKQKQIWIQPVKSFHMRYHTTTSDLRIKILPIFDPLWRHNGSFPGVSDVIKSWPLSQRRSLPSFIKIVRAVLATLNFHQICTNLAFRVPWQNQVRA